MFSKILFIFLLNFSFVSAQINGKTIALLNFKGIGLNTTEAIALTNIFNKELTKTKVITMLDRKIIKQTFSDQSIMQIKCSTLECISKAGAFLSVELIINGTVQKKNNSFSLKVNIFEVSSAMKPMVVTSLVDGKVVVRKKLKESKISPLKTKEINYTGNTDGFINAIEIMAWELVELEPPKQKIDKQEQITEMLIAQNYNRNATIIRSTFLPGFGQFYSGKKKWGWFWLGTEALLGALAFSEYSSYKTELNNFNSYQKEYSISKHPEKIELLRIKTMESRKKMITADDQMTSILYAAGGLWVANILHAMLLKPKVINATNNNSSIDLVYNKINNQPELSFSIKLD